MRPEAVLHFEQDRIEARIVLGVQHVLVDADGLQIEPDVQAFGDRDSDAHAEQQTRAVVVDIAGDDDVSERLVESLRALAVPESEPYESAVCG